MTVNQGVRGAAHEAKHSNVLAIGVAVGLWAYGLVHVVIAWLALQVAWSDDQNQTSPSGAVSTLAKEPFGAVLLVAGAVGLVALVVWQGIEAAIGHRGKDGMERLRQRVAAAARAVVYAVLAFTMVSQIVGSSGGGKGSTGMTAQLMKAPAGVFLVGAIGVGILAVGGYLVYKGLTKGFDEDLEPSAGEPTMRLGQVGYVAKGVAFGVVGVLFVWAAASHDPSKGGGLDQALTTLLKQPFGAYLLTAVALGIGCFGVYCAAWARHRRRD